MLWELKKRMNFVKFINDYGKVLEGRVVLFFLRIKIERSRLVVFGWRIYVF